MKYKKIISFLFVLSALFVSCNNANDIPGDHYNKPNGLETREQVTDEIPVSVKEKNDKQDSLFRAFFTEQIDCLRNDIKNCKDSIKSTNEIIKETEEKGNNNHLLIWIIALITVVSSLYIAIKTHKRLKRLDIGNSFKEFLTNSKRFQAIEQKVKELEVSTKQKNAKFNEQRINDIENRLNSVINYLNKKVQEQNSTTKQAIKQVQQGHTYSRKYADLHNGEYFIKMYESKQETCVYEVILHNEKEAEFHLISIDKIKSRNELETAIEISGKCQLADASSFRELNGGGIIEKIDENTWKVTKKLAIEIS